MKRVNLEKIGRSQKQTVREAVRGTSERKIESREAALDSRLGDWTGLRKLAAELRRHVIERLPEYLEQAEKNLKRNGIQVHWARDADEARLIVGEICQRAGAKVIAKSKSMVTEEIELNPYLESLGMEPVETDLGEFVVQLEGERPSHIVTPIIHISGKRVAEIFKREGLGPYTEDPEELTLQARRHMREVFQRADVGISGANFVAADTGRLIAVTNEGNLRFAANAPRIHIALTGIEKIIAREREIGVFLKLLSRSSNGQELTVYTHFFGSPRKPGEPDGPEEIHLVFVDNGRSQLYGSEFQEMLHCIRCGACLNVCPVYRAVSGMAYDSVYPGPMGAILSPLLGGEAAFEKYSQLPFASSLCGACEKICPVAIPIPRMLLSLRAKLHRHGLKLPASPSFTIWGLLATRPRLWRLALALGRRVGWWPARFMPMASMRSWLKERDLPDWPKESFREYWRRRQFGKGGKSK